jgi:hypothetical protein
LSRSIAGAILASVTMFAIRVSTLRLWLQPWDARTGHLLSESTGEVTVAAPVIATESTVSLDHLAQQLWSRMIKRDLPESTSESWRGP